MATGLGSKDVGLIVLTKYDNGTGTYLRYRRYGTY